MQETGQYWLAKLPTHIQRQLKENIVRNGSDVERYLERSFDSLFRVIDDAFTWTDSAESEGYWSEIYDSCYRDNPSFERLYEVYPQYSQNRDEVINHYEIY